MMNDDQIIEILRTSKRGKALDKLYRYYPKVENMIRSNGGEKQDAQDLFQEALIIFCKKITDSQFALTASINTYVYSICKILWLKELKKKQRGATVKIETELTSTQEEERQERRKEGRRRQRWLPPAMMRAAPSPSARRRFRPNI